MEHYNFNYCNNFENLQEISKKFKIIKITNRTSVPNRLRATVRNTFLLFAQHHNRDTLRTHHTPHRAGQVSPTLRNSSDAPNLPLLFLLLAHLGHLLSSSSKKACWTSPSVKQIRYFLSYNPDRFRTSNSRYGAIVLAKMTLARSRRQMGQSFCRHSTRIRAEHSKQHRWSHSPMA